MAARRFDPLGADGGNTDDSRKGGPARLGDLLSTAVANRGWSARLHGARVHEAWLRIVGPELARHTEPVRLHGGVLVLRAESSLWATQVHYLATDLAAKANAELGEGQVRRVTVVVGALHNPAADHGKTAR